MSEEQVAWADWLEAFGKAAYHPLAVEYQGEPQKDYRDEDVLIDGCGTPPDAAILARTVRHLSRVTGTMAVSIILSRPPEGYRIRCDVSAALVGPDLPSDGRNLLSYLDGHMTINGIVRKALKADYLSGDDFDDWDVLSLDVDLTLKALTYSIDGLILTILVDYDANS